MKTAMQILLEILESKILPCDDDNSYVYGMNVAHANIIYNIKNGFLEKEKEQIQKAFSDGQETPINHPTLPHYSNEEYYNDNYNQNKKPMNKIYAVTGTLHGSIIEAINEGQARKIFHKKYNGENILLVKDISTYNVSNL